MDRNDYGRDADNRPNQGRGDRDSRVYGAAPRGRAEYGQGRPNYGSARSDYGERAYGGHLDDEGRGRRESGGGFFDTITSWFSGSDENEHRERIRREMREQARRDLELGYVPEARSERRGFDRNREYGRGREMQRRDDLESGSLRSARSGYAAGRGYGDREAYDRGTGSMEARRYNQPSRTRYASTTTGYGRWDQSEAYPQYGPAGTYSRRDLDEYGLEQDRGRRTVHGEGYRVRERVEDRESAPIGVTNRSYDAVSDEYRNTGAASYGVGRLNEVSYDPRTFGTGATAYGTMYGQSTGYGVPVSRYSGNILEGPAYERPLEGNRGQYGARQTRGHDRDEAWERRDEWHRGEIDQMEVRGFNEEYHPYGIEGEERRGPFTGRGPKNYTRSDERIREDLNDRLAENDRIDASDVEVKVENGIVTLSGKVEDRRMKYMAEDLAETISGVKDVQNEIRVEKSDRTYRSGQIF